MFEPGSTIVERGLHHGVLAYARPQRVVSHTADLIASTIRVGTDCYGILPKSRETAYEELARGELVWGMRSWTMFNALVLVRPGDAYSVLGFWDENANFAGWYINLQDPIRFNALGYDTADHTLDLVIGEDLTSWMWKDEHEVELAIEMGLHTAEQAQQARKTGEGVIALLESGDVWWREWRAFEIDLAAPLPVLPDGWDAI